MCKVNSVLYQVHKSSPVGGRRAAAGNNHWVPNTDVYVTESSLVIKVELAGMRREDLELTVESNRLMISGHRPDGCRAPKCTFLVMEINYGSFECVIEVPPGYDLSQAKAAYQNGFLRVDVPQTKRNSSSKPLPVAVTEPK
jgi:HSP20 family protein